MPRDAVDRDERLSVLLVGMIRARGTIPVEVRLFEILYNVAGRLLTYDEVCQGLGSRTKNARNFCFQIAKLLRDIVPEGWSLVNEVGKGYRLLEAYVGPVEASKVETARREHLLRGG